MERIASVCPHCGCGCGLYLLVDREEVLGVMPSAGHPISRGSLCLKGWMSFQHLRQSHRLESPHIRKNGELEVVSWDRALSRTIEGLQGVRETYGGQAVGFWASGRTTNEELFLLDRIAAEGFGTKAIWLDPDLHTLDHVPASLVEGPRVARFDEIPTADLLVIFGQNLDEHHPQVASRILRAMDQGTRAVVVSPRRDLLARAATHHLQAAAPEEVAASLADGTGGEPNPFRALWMEAARPLLIYPLKSLPLLRETRLLQAVERLLSRFPAKVLLLFPRTNSRGAFQRRKGRGLNDTRALKALVVLEENPAGWEDGFRDLVPELELLVVQDLFLTETTGLAHVVLPSASFAEKGGTLLNTEGRAQGLQPAVSPPGDARPGWAILAELARRLGIPDVGSTLEEIQRGMRSEHVGAAPVATRPQAASGAAADPPRFQHIPDRLGCLWLSDTLLRHTDDWQREHQDRWIDVHPEDAKALGLRPGWVVRIAGEGRDFTATVRISDEVGRGLLCSPHALVEGQVSLERAA
ncbi:MAG TPA: molybdopterin-dependent oxidoreductase [Candidatus Methylomirabilis sp.]|nr:molybdopterin-dependent oxidoreductase [Candidatus Methylomirabilis sp.]